MSRFSLPIALLMALVAARPAASVLTDDEPSNNLIGTAAVQIVPTAAVTTDGGEFALVYDDIDYLGIGNLVKGDIVTVSTTPLEDAEFEDPDTFIGLFTSGGSMECNNDDTNNNDVWNPLNTGFGSLCRFVIESAGTWFVGVTGAEDPSFDGDHFQDGVYELHVTINAIDPPTPAPTATPTATPRATPTATPTVAPTPTPTATPTSTPTATPTTMPTSTPTPTPEPSLLLQLVSGLLGLAMLDKRRRSANR
jgi:hypothetical protein